MCRSLVGIRGDGGAQLREWQPVRAAEFERSAVMQQVPLSFSVGRQLVGLGQSVA